MMSKIQTLEHATILLYHELVSCPVTSQQIRFIARAGRVDDTTHTLQARCPENHSCDLELGLTCSYQLAERHGYVQSGDLVEIVGFVDKLHTCSNNEPTGTRFNCECWILRNMNGLDYENYKKSHALLWKDW